MAIHQMSRALWKHWRQDIPQPSIVKLFYRRGVVFVHVPKCGGSSVEKSLRSAYPLSRIRIDSERSAAAVQVAAGGGLTVRETLQAASVMRSHVLHYVLGAGYACITGHAPLRPGLIDRFSGSHGFVTILRDPTERFKSHYRFNNSVTQGGQYGHISEPIEAFLETPRAQDFGRMFIKYFAEVETGLDYDLNVAIETSKRTLGKMELVGFVDRMDLFAKGVSAIRGRTILIGHENKGDEKNSKPFSESVERRIREICAPDLEIYQWARSKFLPDT